MSSHGRPLTHRRAVTAFALLSAGGAMASLSACGGSDAPTKAESYCGQVQIDLPTLSSPNIAIAADIEATIALYQGIVDVAPIAIQAEWQQLVSNLETAASVESNDPTSLQQAADMARASESAAIRIQQYTSQVCALSIGQVPPVTDPVAATIVPPSSQPPSD